MCVRKVPPLSARRRADLSFLSVGLRPATATPLTSTSQTLDPRICLQVLPGCNNSWLEQEGEGSGGGDQGGKNRQEQARVGEEEEEGDLGDVRGK